MTKLGWALIGLGAAGIVVYLLAAVTSWRPEFPAGTLGIAGIVALAAGTTVLVLRSRSMKNGQRQAKP